MRLYDYGLSTLEQYQLTAIKSSRTRGALLCHTEKGSFVIRECHSSEKKLRRQQELQQYILAGGFCTDLYLDNQEGNLITYDKDGIPYTLQYWYEGKECDTKSRDDIEKSICHLAKLHNVMKLCKMNDCIEDSLEQEYIRHNQELRKIRKFIRKKGPTNDFEKDYFYSAEWFIERAEDTLSMLQSSSYNDLRQKAINDGTISHGEYNQHNVWMTKEGVVVTNWGQWKVGLQITDLYQFLRKIMEKYGWDIGMATGLLKLYHEHKPIEPEEWENLKIRFSYPEKYWKLANYYYTHNKAWVSEKNTEKMRAVIDQKERWVHFTEQCFGRYPF